MVNLDPPFPIYCNILHLLLAANASDVAFARCTLHFHALGKFPLQSSFEARKTQTFVDTSPCEPSSSSIFTVTLIHRDIQWVIFARDLYRFAPLFLQCGMLWRRW
jgi:hypothetical protein